MKLRVKQVQPTPRTAGSWKGKKLVIALGRKRNRALAIAKLQHDIMTRQDTFSRKRYEGSPGAPLEFAWAVGTLEPIHSLAKKTKDEVRTEIVAAMATLASVYILKTRFLMHGYFFGYFFCSYSS